MAEAAQKFLEVSGSKHSKTFLDKEETNHTITTYSFFADFSTRKALFIVALVSILPQGLTWADSILRLFV